MKRILLTLAAVIFLGSPLLAGVSAARDNNLMTRTGKVNPSALREMLTKGLKATRRTRKSTSTWSSTWSCWTKLPVAYVYASFTYAQATPRLPLPVL